MLITIRLSTSAPEREAIVVARRHHVAGYPVSTEARTAGTGGSVDEILDTIRAWIDEFVRPPRTGTG